jgi:hypothetical protein
MSITPLRYNIFIKIRIKRIFPKDGSGEDSHFKPLACKEAGTRHGMSLHKLKEKTLLLTSVRNYLHYPKTG